MANELDQIAAQQDADRQAGIRPASPAQSDPNAPPGKITIAPNSLADAAEASIAAGWNQNRLDEAVRNAKPLFVTDGNGIRGPQKPPRRTEDEPRRTDFDRGSIVRPTQPIVTQVAGSDQGVSGTNVDLYGAYNGAPALFHLVQTAPPTAPPP